MSKPTKIIGHTGTVRVPAGTSAIFSSDDADVGGKNPGLMEKYLAPLNGRRFQDRKDYKGDLVNMNIVIVELSADDRKKILEKEGDEFDGTDEYEPILNDVTLSATDLTKGYPAGYPAGYNNYRFKDWKLSQITFDHLK